MSSDTASLTAEYQIGGKVAIVTGAASGIGYSLTRTFLKNGAKVSILDYDSDKGQKTCRELQKEHGESSVFFIEVDVTKREQLAAAFRKTKEVFGQIDIVCNNAGVEEQPDFRRLIEINLVAVIEGTLLAIDHMSTQKRGNGGVVINTSSIGGLIGAPPAPFYCASKHGVVGYTRSCELLRASDGVRVNCICPSFVDTPMIRNNLDKFPPGSEPPEGVKQRLEYMKTHCLSPDDVAEIVLERLIKDQSKAGAVCSITFEKGTFFPKLLTPDDFGFDMSLD